VFRGKKQAPFTPDGKLQTASEVSGDPQKPEGDAVPFRQIFSMHKRFLGSDRKSPCPSGLFDKFCIRACIFIPAEPRA
jgi:hypothetical protein